MEKGINLINKSGYLSFVLYNYKHTIENKFFKCAYLIFSNITPISKYSLKE